MNNTNEIIEKLYQKLDAQDKIIDEQALEISQLKQRNKEIYDGFMVAIDEVCETDREKRKYKDRIDKAIEYIQSEKVIKEGNTLEQITNYEKKLLEILGDKENE